MQIIKIANRHSRIRISKKEWLDIGRKTGWIRNAQDQNGVIGGTDVGMGAQDISSDANAINIDTGNTDVVKIQNADMLPNVNASDMSPEEMENLAAFLGQKPSAQLAPEQMQILNNIRSQLPRDLTTPRWMQDPKSKAVLYNALSTLTPQDVNKLRSVVKNIQKQNNKYF